MVQVREVSLRDHIDDISPLMQANWDETGFGFPFDLNTTLYKNLEAQGCMVVVAAFDGAEIVGYSLSSILPHPYNPAVLMCNSDALFVRKDLRGTSVGARLMRMTEEIAAERGAVRMLWHTRGGTGLAEVLAKRGYQTADHVMMKEL